MSWHPSDLVTDQDLVDYETNILTQFGKSDWQPRRAKALEDWLFPILSGHGFNPQNLRTQFQPDVVFGYTGAVYTDKTGAAQSATTDDVNLATLFATPSTDALYIGSVAPFRGAALRLLDTVSAVAGTLSVAYWSGTWDAMIIRDGTAKTTGKPFSGGGSVTWALPGDWATRVLNGSDPLYWVKVTTSAVPTGALLSQVGCIRSSALRAPATLRTLMLIMREAPTGSGGPWAAKADYYEKEADASLQRALLIVGGEFDSDADNVIDPAEEAQTDTQAGGGWKLERA
jgi:hypothetical protein